jgi:hypothetical protein
MRKASTLFLLTCLVAALPAMAADPVIFKGIDPWKTAPDGTSYSDFKLNPIPAGFFCEGSAPFTGRIAWKGQPLALAGADTLKAVDTIVERLDDATFDAQGVAHTRIQIRALSLVSLQPIQTSCGRFNVSMSLAGEQRITTMRIVREHERGGRFFAPVAVDARLSFRPVGRRTALAQQFQARVNFPAHEDSHWASPRDPAAALGTGPVQVDTNGDRRPDTTIAGTSNFVAGARASSGLENIYYDYDPNCHCDQVIDVRGDYYCYHTHCTQVPY